MCPAAQKKFACVSMTIKNFEGQVSIYLRENISTKKLRVYGYVEQGVGWSPSRLGYCVRYRVKAKSGDLGPLRYDVAEWCVRTCPVVKCIG
jgi:hypothetical protein